MEVTFVKYCREYFEISLLVTDDSEVTMTPILDLCMNVLVSLTNTLWNRVRNTVSQRKKPDYTIVKYGVPIIIGEEKVFSKYKPGIFGHDPVVELEKKML
jgi:hypothetical protein